MSNKKKTKEPVLDKQEDWVAELIRRLKEDPNYVSAFLVTLEINKIESVHQERDKPMVFIKILDDLGIIQSFEPNPAYGDRLPTPKTEFTQEEAKAIFESFDKERYHALSVMLVCGQLEQFFLNESTNEELLTDPPMIFKTFDKDGFPVSYGINREVKNQLMRRMPTS